MDFVSLTADQFAALDADDLASLPLESVAPPPWKPTLGSLSYVPQFRIYRYDDYRPTATIGLILRMGQVLVAPRCRPPITVEIESSFLNSEIRCTLDGSVPVSSSPLYISPLILTKNMTTKERTVVQARIFSTDNPLLRTPNVFVKIDLR